MMGLFIPPHPDLEPSPGPVRRFTLLDAMVLVGATAAGLALDRAAWSSHPFSWDLTARRTPLGWAANGIAPSVPVAAMWTIAILTLQLGHPRDWPGQWLRRPGMKACAAASCGLSFGFVLEICATPRGSYLDPRLAFGFVLPLTAGFAVAAVWDFSILVRGYRAASDWIDRLGWLIGLYWVVLVFLIMLQLLISILAGIWLLIW